MNSKNIPSYFHEASLIIVCTWIVPIFGGKFSFANSLDHYLSIYCFVLGRCCSSYRSKILRPYFEPQKFGSSSIYLFPSEQIQCWRQSYIFRNFIYFSSSTRRWKFLHIWIIIVTIFCYNHLYFGELPEVTKRYVWRIWGILLPSMSISIWQSGIISIAAL